jgi:N-acyl-D-aspartate/D-glutamate deacylase
MPVQVPMNMSFLHYCALNMIPGWGEILGLPVPERMAKLADPAVRAMMLERAQGPDVGVFKRLTSWGNYIIGDTYSPANDGLRERRVADIAADRGTPEFDTLLDIVVADDLRTILWPIPTDGDPESWRLRAELWNDERAMLGGSDAGAHLDRMCGAPYTTRFIGDVLRGRQLTTLERAVQMLTDVPARLFGLRDRGRIEPGYFADLVLLDPETVGAGHATMVADLPGGTARLTATADGVRRVFVNGVETVRDNEPTGTRPGTLLRSGRDTETVLP